MRWSLRKKPKRRSILMTHSIKKYKIYNIAAYVEYRIIIISIQQTAVDDACNFNA